MVLKLTRQVRLDPRRDEHGPALDWLLESTLNEAVGDGDLGDLALVQICFELAIGNLRHLGGRREQILKRHQKEEGRDPVADIELGFLVHFHFCRSGSVWSAAPA
jgi:hypothetical protein